MFLLALIRQAESSAPESAPRQRVRAQQCRQIYLELQLVLVFNLWICDYYYY